MTNQQSLLIGNARKLKYRNKPTVCGAEHNHASKAEARRCDHLRVLERIGEISGLEQQPRFPCAINGKKLCTYVADFAYIDEAGCRVIEDVKGLKTPMYRLKKKLVEALYLGVVVIEVGV